MIDWTKPIERVYLDGSHSPAEVLKVFLSGYAAVTWYSMPKDKQIACVLSPRDNGFRNVARKPSEFWLVFDRYGEKSWIELSAPMSVPDEHDVVHVIEAQS